MRISALQHRLPKHQLVSVTDTLGDKVHNTYDPKRRRTNTSNLLQKRSLVRSLDTICGANTTPLRTPGNCHVRCTALCL